MYTAHGELNAILNYRGGSLDNAKIYVTLFPCNECAKAIIQSGIKTVVYENDKYADTVAVWHQNVCLRQQASIFIRIRKQAEP